MCFVFECVVVLDDVDKLVDVYFGELSVGLGDGCSVGEMNVGCFHRGVGLFLYYSVLEVVFGGFEVLDFVGEFVGVLEDVFFAGAL